MWFLALDSWLYIPVSSKHTPPLLFPPKVQNKWGATHQWVMEHMYLWLNLLKMPARFSFEHGQLTCLKMHVTNKGTAADVLSSRKKLRKPLGGGGVATVPSCIIHRFYYNNLLTILSESGYCPLYRVLNIIHWLLLISFLTTWKWKSATDKHTCALADPLKFQ